MSEPDGGPPSPFVCRRCGSCCSGRGGVWLDGDGLAAAAGLLGLGTEAAAELYLRPADGLWEVGTSADGRCLFWSGGGCLIHSAKPVMCRLWPFFYGPLRWEEAFAAARDACPGLSGWNWASFSAAFQAGGERFPPKSFRTALKRLPS